MPSLGADMDSATLTEWMVKPGDSVRRGDVVATVETTKGIIDIEIFGDGVMETLLVEPGAQVEVGATLAIYRGPDEAAPPTPAVSPSIAARSGPRGEPDASPAPPGSCSTSGLTFCASSKPGIPRCIVAGVAKARSRTRCSLSFRARLSLGRSPAEDAPRLGFVSPRKYPYGMVLTSVAPSPTWVDHFRAAWRGDESLAHFCIAFVLIERCLANVSRRGWQYAGMVFLLGVSQQVLEQARDVGAAIF